MSDNFPQFAQGQASPASEADLQRDASGITNPNLHRRIDNSPLELTKNEYVLADEADEILCDEQEEELLVNTVDAFDGKDSLALNDTYRLSVSGVNSFRTINHIVHHEESINSEIP